MARLGELLVAARLLDPTQVERALQAQVVWGGRLGTNLIELGVLDLEAISRTLGRQHGMPAALARHFDKADRELQERLSAELAEKWAVVPLFHVGARKQQIAVAAIDPLPRDARDELADAFLCAPDAIVVSVAPEMRVRYQLERAYAVARPARFLRSKKRQSATPFPQFDNIPVPIESDVEIALPVVVEPPEPVGEPPRPVEPDVEPDHRPVVEAPAEPSGAQPLATSSAEEIARLIEEALAELPPDDAPEPSGRDRRTYVRTVDETARDFPALPRPPADAARTAAATASTPARQASPTSPQHTQPLARVVIKRVPAPGDGGRPAVTLLEATRAIRRATNRDRVGELVIDTLQRFVPAAEAAVLLVVRGDVAISWASFSRTGSTAGDIAVPLDQPGLLPRVVGKNAIARASVEDLGPIDSALLRSLGDLQGDLVIVPIAVADEVVGMIATATEADAMVDGIESVAAAAAAAIARLIRDASR